MNSNLTCTIFRNIHDRDCTSLKYFSSWNSFVNFLRQCYKNPAEKPPRDANDLWTNKKYAQLFTPAVFREPTGRKIDNVKEWSRWAAVDIDDKLTRDELNKLFGKIKKYSYVAYNSASASKSHVKMRIVFELTDCIPHGKIKHFWFALNSSLGTIVDPQTKDLTRIYYLPGKYVNAFSFFISNAGKPINPFEIINNFEYIESDSFSSSLKNSLTPALRRAALEEMRKDNKEITWNNYSDCPFVSSDAILAYRSLSGNWYHGMFRFMCSVAGRAKIMGYILNSNELGELARQLDADTGYWYKNRKFETEAERALNFVVDK